MSWQACDWMDSLAYDVCGPLASRVLLKLANVANTDGTRAWRSKAEMAHELGVSQRSIQRALKELEHAALIHPGEQEFVHHIRADRRPTVYDLNFRYVAQYSAPELPVWNGETELSTGGHGETSQGLTGRQLLSHYERSVNDIKDSSRDNHTGQPVAFDRCPAGHRLIDDHCEYACKADFERRERLYGVTA